MYQIVEATRLVAEAESYMAALSARSFLANEMGVNPLNLIILFPPDAVLPVLGGGTATAAEMGLPLVTS